MTCYPCLLYDPPVVSWRAGSTQRYVTGKHPLVVLIYTLEDKAISLAKVKDPRINGYDRSTIFSTLMTRVRAMTQLVYGIFQHSPENRRFH